MMRVHAGMLLLMFGACVQPPETRWRYRLASGQEVVCAPPCESGVCIGDSRWSQYGRGGMHLNGCDDGVQMHYVNNVTSLGPTK